MSEPRSELKRVLDGPTEESSCIPIAREQHQLTSGEPDTWAIVLKVVKWLQLGKGSDESRIIFFLKGL